MTEYKTSMSEQRDQTGPHGLGLVMGNSVGGGNGGIRGSLPSDQLLSDPEYLEKQ